MTPPTAHRNPSGKCFPITSARNSAGKNWSERQEDVASCSAAWIPSASERWRYRVFAARASSTRNSSVLRSLAPRQKAQYRQVTHRQGSGRMAGYSESIHLSNATRTRESPVTPLKSPSGCWPTGGYHCLSIAWYAGAPHPARIPAGRN